MAETQEWYDAEGGSLKAEIAEIERQLGGWVAARIALDPRGPKSVSLPSGTISSTKGSLSVDVFDEELFLKWATQNNPDLIAIPAPPPPPPPRPDKAEIKALATANAAAVAELEEPGDHFVVVGEGEEREVVPGVRMVRGDRSVKVDVRGQR